MENVGQGDFVQQLRTLISEAPDRNCTVVMRIDGTHDDANIQVNYGARQIATLKVCISRGDKRRVDTWRLKLLLARAICDIPAGDKEFPDDRINDIFIAAIHTERGSVIMTIQNSQLTAVRHRT